VIKRDDNPAFVEIPIGILNAQSPGLFSNEPFDKIASDESFEKRPVMIGFQSLF